MEKTFPIPGYYVNDNVFPSKSSITTVGMSGVAGTIRKVSDENLIFLSAGLLLGFLASVTINLLSRGYPGIQFLTPDGKSVFEPVAIIYIVGTLFGIYCLLSPYFMNDKKFRDLLNIIAGFLIMMGLSMLGTIL